MLKLTLFCGEINLKTQIEHVINVINLTHTKKCKITKLETMKENFNFLSYLTDLCLLVYSTKMATLQKIKQ